MTKLNIMEINKTNKYNNIIPFGCIPCKTSILEHQGTSHSLTYNITRFRVLKQDEGRKALPTQKPDSYMDLMTKQLIRTQKYE